MITGDKMETAINIGYSCKLFPMNLELIIVEANYKFLRNAIIKAEIMPCGVVISGDVLLEAEAIKEKVIFCKGFLAFVF